MQRLNPSTFVDIVQTDLCRHKNLIICGWVREAVRVLMKSFTKHWKLYFNCFLQLNSCLLSICVAKSPWHIILQHTIWYLDITNTSSRSANAEMVRANGYFQTQSFDSYYLVASSDQWLTDVSYFFILKLDY